MDLVDQYKKLEGRDLAFAVFAILSSIALGVLWIWLLAPAKIEAFGVGKLAFLGAVLMFPSVALTSVVIAFADTKSKLHKEHRAAWLLVSGGVLSLLSTSLALAIAFWFSLSVRWCVGLVGLLWCAQSIAVIVNARWGSSSGSDQTSV